MRRESAYGDTVGLSENIVQCTSQKGLLITRRSLAVHNSHPFFFEIYCDITVRPFLRGATVLSADSRCVAFDLKVLLLKNRSACESCFYSK